MYFYFIVKIEQEKKRKIKLVERRKKNRRKIYVIFSAVLIDLAVWGGKFN